mgnify:CR=1 FL=1
MKWFNNMKIRSKLLIGFTSTTILGCFIGYMMYSAIKRIGAKQVYNFTFMAIVMSFVVGVIILVFMGLTISNTISESIIKLIEAAKKIAAGDMNIDVNSYSKDETFELWNELTNITNSFKGLVTDTNSINDLILQGEVENRVDEKKYNGDYKKIVQGINNIIDVITEPLNESNIVLENMAKNDLTIKMIGSYKGSMKEFAENINAVNLRITNIVKLNTEISVGDISGIDEIIKIGKRSENDEVMPTMISMMSTIKNLIEEVNIISDAAVKGDLETRSDASKFKGGYGEVIKGFNRALDAILQPLSESKKVLESMAVNDLTIKMTGSYEGMMKELAEDINFVNERIGSVSDLFTQASLGDTSRLEGLNKIGRRSENDKLMPAMILMMTTIQNLIKEIGSIADGATKGNLESRCDTLKFKGGYREILEGLNKTLNAVAEPINEATEVLREMAEGNLNVSMVGNYLGSYKVIKDSLNHALDSFNEVFTEINNAADQVSAGSNQVSDGSQALSQGTTEQASSIEELNSSITEVATQTKQNAVNASEANELALIAKDGAVLGNSHMKDMLKSMEDINESSSNISKIIKVIDDIAFQTNMLALNAAVEAARAGQHGKGFAVVAEEVRNLAARSTSAAKQTTDLIEGSIKKVELGTKIANNTAESLNEIVEGVTKATTLVGEIAAASNEQATAIYQINKGIEQVSDVVQTNAATAEQSAAASEELSGQAETLKNMVEKFRLKENTYASNSQVAVGFQSNVKAKKSKFATNTEVAVTKNKPKISLSSGEFGKY